MNKKFLKFCFNFLKQFVARINVQYKSQKAFPARWLKSVWLVFGDGHNWWHQSCWWHLVALAVSLDGNGIKFGLGDDSNLSVEVDAKIIYYSLKEIFRKLKIVFTYSPVITTSGDWTQILAILFFRIYNSDLIVKENWFYTYRNWWCGADSMNRG